MLHETWTRWRRALPLLVLTVCGGCGDPSGSSDTANAIPLFSSAGDEVQRGDADPAAGIRYRTVQINRDLATPGAVAVGGRLLVPGFGGRSFVATVDRTDRDSNNVLSIRGRIEAPTIPGYVILSFDGERMLGSLVMPAEGIRYEIAPATEEGAYEIRELDPLRMTPVGERCLTESAPSVASRPFEASDKAAEAAASAVSPLTEIDVMVVYTYAAWQRWEQRGGIHAAMAQGLGAGQLILDNSRIDLRLRIVHSALVDIPESDCTSQINQLARDREVRGLRQTYGADLVTLVSTNCDGGAWLLQRWGGEPSSGFSVVGSADIHGATLIHELGHNLGAHHNKDQVPFPGPGIFSYSAAWLWHNGNLPSCSVMSYSCGRWLPYFSSPLVAHRGVPTGDAEHGDNARTIRETMGWVSGYLPRRVLRYLYPPVNARGERVQNRSLAQAESVNVLRWDAQPDNKEVDEYRIYVVNDETPDPRWFYDGGVRNKLATTAPSAREYTHRHVEANRQYVYQIVTYRRDYGESSGGYVTIN